MTRFKEYNINNSQLSRTGKPHHNGAHIEMTKLWENQSAWSSPEGEAVCNWNDFLSQQWPSGKSLWVFNRKEEPQSYPSWPTKSTRAQCSVWDASRTRSYSSGLGGILRAVQAMDVTCHELLYQMVRILRSGAMLTGPKFGRYFFAITSMSLFSYTGQTHNPDFRSEGTARQAGGEGELEYQRLGRCVPDQSQTQRGWWQRLKACVCVVMSEGINKGKGQEEAEVQLLFLTPMRATAIPRL